MIFTIILLLISVTNKDIDAFFNPSSAAEIEPPQKAEWGANAPHRTSMVRSSHFLAVQGRIAVLLRSLRFFTADLFMGSVSKSVK